MGLVLTLPLCPDIEESGEGQPRRPPGQAGRPWVVGLASSYPYPKPQGNLEMARQACHLQALCFLGRALRAQCCLQFYSCAGVSTAAATLHAGCAGG